MLNIKKKDQKNKIYNTMHLFSNFAKGMIFSIVYLFKRKSQKTFQNQIKLTLSFENAKKVASVAKTIFEIHIA